MMGVTFVMIDAMIQIALVAIMIMVVGGCVRNLEAMVLESAISMGRNCVSMP